jgi:hypothetical protein
MSDMIILLERAQVLSREARQVRVEAERVVLATDKKCLGDLATMLDAEAGKLELRALDFN